MSPNPPHRSAFTKVELMLVLAILLVVAGILAVGLRRVREAAALSSSTYNLKQFSISVQEMSDQFGKFPPSVGRFPVEKDRISGPNASLFFHIVPYNESSSIYCDYKDKYETIEADAITFKVYRAYADPTITPKPSTLTSYASNAAVFGLTDGGTLQAKDLARRGMSNYVFFMERYAVVGAEQTRHTWNGRGVRDNYLYPPTEALDPDNIATPQFGVASAEACNDAPHAFVRKTFQAAMADGSVRTLTPDVARTFTYADGQRATIWAWACSLDGPLGAAQVPSGW